MRAQLIMAIVMVTLDGGLFDRAVHPFDLAVGPWVVGFRQPMLDPIGVADHVEAHWSGIGSVPVPGLLGELDAVVRQDGVDLVRHGFEHVLEELPSRAPVGLFSELGHSELVGAVDSDEQI